jgi:hypothetical protein
MASKELIEKVWENAKEMGVRTPMSGKKIFTAI